MTSHPILAIDPGSDDSAWLVFDPAACRPLRFGKLPNVELLRAIQFAHVQLSPRLLPDGGHLVIEQVASFGKPVGAEVFETVFWSGRFAQAWEERRGTWSRVKRLEVTMHLCHDSRAKDPHVRQALIDLFGPGKDKAIGRKHAPGPLYGVSQDVWSALAVAVTYANRLPAAGAAAAGGAR